MSSIARTSTNSLQEVFELYVKNYHCEQIFFAGAHDARYSALLAKYKYPEKIRKSLDITLLKRKPFVEGRKAPEDHFKVLRVMSDLFRRNPL